MARKMGMSTPFQATGRRVRDLPRKQSGSRRIRCNGLLVLSLERKAVRECDPRRSESSILVVCGAAERISLWRGQGGSPSGSRKVTPRFGPSMTHKVPESNRIPGNGRCRFILDQLVREHEQRGCKAWDLREAGKMKGQRNWMSWM